MYSVSIKRKEIRKMRDYDINIKGTSNVKIFGTGDDTIVVPSDVKFDSDRNKADIDIKDVSDVKIGIPGTAEKIELNITDSKIFISGLSFEELEIDGKGEITITIDGTNGPIDINMIGGTATLIVPEGFSFCTEAKGRNNRIDSIIAEDHSSVNRIELNGRDSTLLIRNA